VKKVSLTRHKHGDTGGLSRLNYFGIAHRTTRLNDRADTRINQDL
jgi:hypothetical protein